MIYKLRQAVWELTLACCFSCRYCGSKGGNAREQELTTDECLALCDELRDLRCRRVSLIGGEVFMRKDWNLIAERLIDNGIKVAIITNGYIFTDSIIHELKRLKIESVAVSLDGPRDVHDKYRQEGSYDRAIKAIKVLTEAGIATTVISTLNSENVKRLPEFHEILKETGIRAWQLQACSPMGNAANGGIEFRFDFNEVIKFVETFKKLSPFPMGIADNIGYYTESEGTLRGNDNYSFEGCSAGLQTIGIDSIGNIRGCESMYDDRFIEGNIRERSLKDIWEDENSFAYNRKFNFDMMTGACKECEKRWQCAGGCRSYNYFVHGRIYESPACALNQ